jgi:hypothetical protein
VPRDAQNSALPKSGDLYCALCCRMAEREVHPCSEGVLGLSVLSTCVTKQTKDMRYSEVEP